MKIKPKTCWAVISPSGEIVNTGSTQYESVSEWASLEAGYSTAIDGENKAWERACRQGYRCVRVELRAEEIE